MEDSKSANGEKPIPVLDVDTSTPIDKQKAIVGLGGSEKMYISRSMMEVRTASLAWESRVLLNDDDSFLLPLFLTLSLEWGG